MGSAFHNNGRTGESAANAAGQIEKSARQESPEPGTRRINNSPASASIEYRSSRLTITADISSAGHEIILRRVADDLFSHAQRQFTFQQHDSLPPAWALLTELTLRAIAQTYSSTATISPTTIIVRGITADKTAWNIAAARLEKKLFSGIHLQLDVIEIPPRGTLQMQCSQVFRAALMKNKVEFGPDSAVLGSNAFRLLDQLIQIVTDCPQSTLTITGHTDTSGDETNNQQLSAARATAVRNYLTDAGIAAARLQAVGAGSLSPLLTATNAYERRKNRRIEFELLFP